MKRVLGVFAGGLLVLALGALPATSQENGSPPDAGAIIQQGGVDDQVPPDGKTSQIDRVAAAAAPRSGMRIPEGVKRVSPGALLFASFDRNFDGKITREEIEAGAAGAFRAADSNGDGKISGFEQNDWAASVGSHSDILSNGMTFDIDMDRSVTPAEFSSGLLRIADLMVGPGKTEILFSDLVKPLDPSERQAGGGPDLVDPRGRGRNIAPSGLGR